jgi:uncharacterized protein YhfF
MTLEKIEYEIMNDTKSIEAFWEDYLLTLPENERNQQYVEAESWGNSPELADQLANLIRAGTKTTTSSLLWSQQKLQWYLVKPGDKCIVLDSQNAPVCIVEIVEVVIKPFNEVDAEFIYNYGEGDRTLNFWNKNMWEYYQEACEELGMKAQPTMPMICQTFKVIYTG